MVEATLSWACVHPLLFIGVLCALGGGAATLISPSVRRELHRSRHC